MGMAHEDSMILSVPSWLLLHTDTFL